MPTEAPEGNQAPCVLVAPPGPNSRHWLARAKATSAPMGPPRSDSSGIVYASARGVNVTDVDGNRYVDLAAGFGAMLLGHSHPAISAALREQSDTLLQALGDVYPSRERLELEERLLDSCGIDDGKVLLGQSGSDAVTAALKTAVLATGKPGVLGFSGAYHGLGYAPLATCGLRESYRAPFFAQLNPNVVWAPYPTDAPTAQQSLEQVDKRLKQGGIGAVLIEPILGRGGCIVPPPGFLQQLIALAHAAGALLIADEIWTGLGRAGSWLASVAMGIKPDLICLGKGLGGGLPMSACIGHRDVMSAWQREPEVVHTATFSGAALAARTALATLELLGRAGFIAEREAEGDTWRTCIASACVGLPGVVDVRGRGFMIGIDLGTSGLAVLAMRRLLERGYIVSTGGGARDVIVLTPPIVIDATQRQPFVDALSDVLRTL
ncbi:MAG TPA: aminotransferase class III-fold pyridoxal phosphate-dependent enzyme [Polyangiaceae bacterium]